MLGPGIEDPICMTKLLSSGQQIKLIVALRSLNRTIRRFTAHDQAQHCRQLMADAQRASPEKRFAIYRGVLKMGRRYKQPPVQHAMQSDTSACASKEDVASAFGSHFAKPEHGFAMNVSALHSTAAQTLPIPEHVAPEGLPVLQSLARSFADMAPRKTAGPSGLPPEALRGAASRPPDAIFLSC